MIVNFDKFKFKQITGILQCLFNPKGQNYCAPIKPGLGVTTKLYSILFNVIIPG